MDRLTPELTHLLSLSKSGTAWEEFAKWKANHLANQEPVEFNSLPLLLSNEVQKAKHGPPRSLRPSTQQQRSTGERNDLPSA